MKSLVLLLMLATARAEWEVGIGIADTTGPAAQIGMVTSEIFVTCNTRKEGSLPRTYAPEVVATAWTNRTRHELMAAVLLPPVILFPKC